jgi:DNA-binding FadR family transcriptional regulator
MSEPADQLPNLSYGRGRHGDVVTTLGRQIVSGSLQPGEVLNMERVEYELSVSRSVVREAVRVLSAKGLLEARPKRGTIVCPAHRWNLLDPDVIVWKSGNGADQRYLRSWEEVRRIIEPQVVRLAASRRTEEDLVVMGSALERLTHASEAVRRKTTEYITADVSFHHAILTATRNDLLVQLGAMMEDALRQRDAMVHRGGSNQDASFLQMHQAVFRAISEQDEDGAERAMHALLTQSSAVLESVLASKRRAPRKRDLRGVSAGNCNPHSQVSG